MIFEVQQAQFLLVVVGVDNFRWTAYCFVDSSSDNDETDDDDADETNDKDAQIKEDQPQFVEDMIAGDGEQLDANKPIRDPRVYLLRIWEIRIPEIVSEFDYLIHRLEESIVQYVGRSFS